MTDLFLLAHCHAGQAEALVGWTVVVVVVGWQDTGAWPGLAQCQLEECDGVCSVHLV